MYCPPSLATPCVPEAAHPGGGTLAMGFRDQLQALREIDLAELDLSECGLWPAPARWALGSFVFVLTFLGGYALFLVQARESLVQLEGKEHELREAIKAGAPCALLSPCFEHSMRKWTSALSGLSRRLPSETEVPALLADLSRVGTENGLRVRAIDLKPARRESYYDVLPFEIRLDGVITTWPAF